MEVKYPLEDELVSRTMVRIKKEQKGRVVKKLLVELDHLRKMARCRRGRLGVRNIVIILLKFFTLLQVFELRRIMWRDIKIKKIIFVVWMRRRKGANSKEKWLIFKNED